MLCEPVSRAANQTLTLIFGRHFLFHASFVPLIALHVNPDSSARVAWQQDVDCARHILRMLRDDSLASRCLLIIEHLAPSAAAAPADVSAFLEMLQNDPIWTHVGAAQGGDLAQTL